LNSRVLPRIAGTISNLQCLGSNGLSKTHKRNACGQKSETRSDWHLAPPWLELASEDTH
jgi:hypothetical protein